MDRREMEARRADKQVWNGAGDYQLHPWYRAIGPDGQAPVYLNTIVGLAQREGWQETLEPLLRSFEGSARGALSRPAVAGGAPCSPSAAPGLRCSGFGPASRAPGPE